MEEIQELNDTLQMVPIDKQLEWEKQINEIKTSILKQGADYDTFIGNKPSLLKPGAEKFIRAFNLKTHLQTKETLLENGHKDFFSTCTLMFNSGNVLCTAEGSCSTQEKNFRSQPQEKYNNCLKMSSKRALVASVLIGLGLSGLFTQDTEDMPKQTYKQPANGNGNGNGTKPKGGFKNEVCPLCNVEALGKSRYDTGSEYYCYPNSGGCGKGINADQMNASPKDKSMGTPNADVNYSGEPLQEPPDQEPPF